MISRRHTTRRKRTADPFLRGQQDAVQYGFPRNPFRARTPHSLEYSQGYRQALLSLPPAYVSSRIPADVPPHEHPLVMVGPSPPRGS